MVRRCVGSALAAGDSCEPVVTTLSLSIISVSDLRPMRFQFLSGPP
ncbi:hypothetical protein RGUI_4075 [Rhodovulum sp. P5]|nr:hypothetical protein RGUI_4075 [Rhodovulum sp. P5]